MHYSEGLQGSQTIEISIFFVDTIYEFAEEFPKSPIFVGLNESRQFLNSTLSYYSNSIFQIWHEHWLQSALEELWVLFFR